MSESSSISVISHQPAVTKCFAAIDYTCELPNPCHALPLLKLLTIQLRRDDNYTYNFRPLILQFATAPLVLAFASYPLFLFHSDISKLAEFIVLLVFKHAVHFDHIIFAVHHLFALRKMLYNVLF